jgi:hypothetical protein
MTTKLSLSLLAACLCLAAPSAAFGSWFGKSDSLTTTKIEIRDSAYAGIPTNTGRLGLDGMDRLTHVGISVDKSIVRFDFQYQRLVATLDQYQHGLAKTEVLPYTAQLAYDRSTGFVLLQKLEKKVDPSLISISSLHPPTSDDTTHFALFQVSDASIAAFLDASLDHADMLEAYSQKHGDCALGDQIKKALPLERLGTTLPVDHVLYARSLKPAEGCEVAWQQVQLAFNSIFELFDPINPGIAGVRSDLLGGVQHPTSWTPVLEDSHLGTIDSSLSKAVAVLASSGEFHPINYDLAPVVQEFALAPSNQVLMDKKKQQPKYSQRPQDITKIESEQLPTALNLYDVLVELRSDKLKAYRRAPVAVSGS